MKLRGWTVPVPNGQQEEQRETSQIQRNHREKPKMKNRISRDTNLTCPVAGCGRPCQGMQGLTAHMRIMHLTHFRRYGAEPAPAPKGRYVEPVEGVPVAREVVPPFDVTVSESTAQAPPQAPVELLDAAINGLKRRQVEITLEVSRLQALQAEGKAIDSRINALTEARKAFAADEENQTVAQT